MPKNILPAASQTLKSDRFLNPMEYLSQIDPIIYGNSFDPHRFLGLHQVQYASLFSDIPETSQTQPAEKVIRLWHPGAKQLHFELFGEIVEAILINPSGLFEYIVPITTKPSDYRIYQPNGILAHDPYAFLPTFGEMDQYLFNNGVHYQLSKAMGGRLTTIEGVSGVKFAVWAPNAKSVSLIADFNFWNGIANPLRSLGTCGVWELFVPGLTEGEKYKFLIKTQSGELKVKSDPYAYSSELRPQTASIISNLDKFKWNDQKWMQKRHENRNASGPINIYELHLGSWKKRDGQYFLNYRVIAHELAAYCKEMGFNHVELMPIQEHPLDESWGYQVSGFYAATSRFGTPEDFQYFVNHLHENDIGVIVDWVPGHFPTDEFSIGRFDGTALYEHADPRQGFHPHWFTNIFNFGRNEVKNFLIANALFWIETMHIDGLRVDAVASMLYLDYGRENGEWISNQFGGKENLEAIEFLKHLNSVVHQRHPGVWMIAEESTAFPGVSHPVEYGGLGFDMKWNMGWMNDTLRYFSKDPVHRCYHQHELTFGLLYAFTEKFVSVLSHDEVVHGKNSLIGKMPGDYWQKFANLRLLYSYMMCQPGKKLWFMGGEFAQWNEWSCKHEIEWFLLQFPAHKGVQIMIKDLNHFYLASKPLWQSDFDFTGFDWVDFHDAHNSIISYLRKGDGEFLLCVHNFTPQTHWDYNVYLRNLNSVQEVFNSDSVAYGGSGKVNEHPPILHDNHGNAYAVRVVVAPLSTMIFKITFN